VVIGKGEEGEGLGPGQPAAEQAGVADV
jgi:hypothetical protein